MGALLLSFFMKNHTRGNIISAADAFYKKKTYINTYFQNQYYVFIKKHERSNNISAAGAFYIKKVYNELCLLWKVIFLWRNHKRGNLYILTEIIKEVTTSPPQAFFLQTYTRNVIWSLNWKDFVIPFFWRLIENHDKTQIIFNPGLGQTKSWHPPASDTMHQKRWYKIDQ